MKSADLAPSISVGSLSVKGPAQPGFCGRVGQRLAKRLLQDAIIDQDPDSVLPSRRSRVQRSADLTLDESEVREAAEGVGVRVAQNPKPTTESSAS